MTVTVQGTDGVLIEGVPVNAFDGTTYTGYNKTTDANGETSLTQALLEERKKEQARER